MHIKKCKSRLGKVVKALIAVSAGAMQKSKSSSNVGQFVSKKIFKSRSSKGHQSQPLVQPQLTAEESTPQWTPQGRCIWASATGRRIEITGSTLQELTDVEAALLKNHAIEKLSQIDGIGVTQSLFDEVERAVPVKQKRRVALIKRKALTTSIFDTGKNKDDSKAYKSASGGVIFGLPLDKCIENDYMNNKGAHYVVSSGRSSRNSLCSLATDKHKDNTSGSCESLSSRSCEGMQTFNPCDIDSQDEDDAFHNQERTHRVPSIVSKCIKYLEENGLHTVGIFRVSVALKRIRELREGFDKGGDVSFDKFQANDIASLLKEYLRDLPEPLLCRHLYVPFLLTQSNVRNRRLQLETLVYLVRTLPPAHRDTLYVLLRLLSVMAKNSDDQPDPNDPSKMVPGNRMDSHNLATVIAPNILHCIVPGSKLIGTHEVSERLDAINVVRIMIDHFDKLFVVSAETMDEIYINMMDSNPKHFNALCNRRYSPSRSAFFAESFRGGDNDNEGSFHGYVNQVIPNNNHGKQRYSAEALMPHRVYSREDVMHEHAGKGGHNGADSKRERASRMKYVESDDETTRRRRRDKSAHESLSFMKSQPDMMSPQFHSKGRSSSIDSLSSMMATPQYQLERAALQQYQQQQQQPPQAPARRLSSPYVSHGGSVLTASLMIPVHTVQTSSNVHKDGQQLDLGADIPGIPFIEDGSYSGESIDARSSEASGRSSFRKSADNPQTASTIKSSMGAHRKSLESHYDTAYDDGPISTTYQIPIAYEGRMLNTAQSTIAATKSRSITDQMKKLSKTHAAPTSLGLKLVKTDKLSGILPSHSEPKISPSITNIGGAVMRSKTADFERILMQNKKYKNNSGDSQYILPDGNGGVAGAPDAIDAAIIEAAAHANANAATNTTATATTIHHHTPPSSIGGGNVYGNRERSRTGAIASLAEPTPQQQQRARSFSSNRPSSGGPTAPASGAISKVVGSKLSAPSMGGHASGSAQSSSGEPAKRHGHIYKRQEIISSVHNKSK